LKIADAPRVPGKQANKILLLADNNDALRFFDWMRAHAVRPRPKNIFAQYGISKLERESRYQGSSSRGSVILVDSRIFAPRFFWGDAREKDHFIRSDGFHRRNDGACR
jgi:hypothetical protein